MASSWIEALGGEYRFQQRVTDVLIEQDGMGRTEQFLTIAVPGHRQGEIVPVRVVGTRDDQLLGEAVRTAA